MRLIKLHLLLVYFKELWQYSICVMCAKTPIAQHERGRLRPKKFLANFLLKEADPLVNHCLIRTLKTHPPVLALLSSWGQKPSFRWQ